MARVLGVGANLGMGDGSLELPQLLLREDHGCNCSCTSVTGLWPVAWIGLDDDHLRAVSLMTGPDWAIELTAITFIKAGTLPGG